jgi:hypothetical protein
VTGLEPQKQLQKTERRNWLLKSLDKLIRRIAVVPSVNKTVNALKEIGVDLTKDETFS